MAREFGAYPNANLECSKSYTPAYVVKQATSTSDFDLNAYQGRFWKISFGEEEGQEIAKISAPGRSTLNIPDKLLMGAFAGGSGFAITGLVGALLSIPLGAATTLSIMAVLVTGALGAMSAVYAGCYYGNHKVKVYGSELVNALRDFCERNGYQEDSSYIVWADVDKERSYYSEETSLRKTLQAYQAACDEPISVNRRQAAKQLKRLKSFRIHQEIVKTDGIYSLRGNYSSYG